MIKCPKCGKELPDGTDFCLDCFTSLIEKPAKARPLKKTGRVALFLKNKQFKIACSVIAAFAVTVTGTLLMKRYIKPTVTVAADDTTLVEVTDENGEAVTDESGEAVMAVVVEVTGKNGEAVTKSDGSKKLQTVVPVTNRSGEAVTSKDGQQVFEVVTQSPSPTESTTKKGLFSKLFGDDNQGDNNTSTAAPSSATTEKSEETTAKPTTQPATQPTTQPATQPTNNQPTSSGFEYDIYNGYVRILKYTGSDKNVVVPAEIDGMRVGYLGTNAFPTNIKTITFNSNIYNGFICLYKCSELEAVYINNSTKYKSVDGVVFSSGGELIHYPAGKRTIDYTMPDFCTRLSKNCIMDNPYIRTFSFAAVNDGQYRDSQVENFMGCSNLTAIKTYKDTDLVKSIDGVLYFLDVGTFATEGIGISDYTQFIFPAGKQTSYYEFPAEYRIYIGANSFCGNPYITSAKFRNKVGFGVLNLFNSKYAPKNLKTYYFPDNEEQHAFYDNNERSFKAYRVTVEFY